MSRIILSAETNPYFNVAAEYMLCLEQKPQTRLFLWQNSPAVVLGRNQSFSAECDMDFMKAEGIFPVRRFSGGGAVFHDLGNLNFTFLDREENAAPDRYLDILRSALCRVGIPCEFSSRNDLLYMGKKFSGHAYFADRGSYFYHGTIMVDVNMSMLSRALRPSFLKLQSKGIKSVRSRVVNLREITPSITVEQIRKALIATFAQEEGISPAAITLEQKTTTPVVQNMISGKEWIFGETPNFAVTFSRQLCFGIVTISANIANGRITCAKIHSDGLLPLDWSACENKLIGMLFQESIIAQQIEICYNQIKHSLTDAHFMPGV
ncbi:lipoate--protein ligase [Caproiciproducens sp.]